MRTVLGRTWRSTLARTLAVTAVISASLAIACDDSENVSYDHTYFVWFYVANASTQDVVVDWGFRRAYWPHEPAVIPAGTRGKIHYYEEFLGPPPDAGVEFTCISVYRSSDQRLVYQVAPVKNRHWTQREIAPYRIEFTLRLTDAKLDTTLENGCATLKGTAVDGLSGAALDALFAAVLEDSMTSYYPMQTSTCPGKFLYSFMWTGEMTAAELRFYRQGYTMRSYRLPDDAVDKGKRYYELNPVLTPAAPSP